MASLNPPMRWITLVICGCISITKLLASDNFAQATVLSGTYAQSTLNTQSATFETGEDAGGYRSVWWAWVAPASGRLVADTNGSVATTGGTWGKYLTAYTGKSATPNIMTLARISTAGGQTTPSPSLSFPVTAGTTYYFKVYSYNSSAYGVAQLTLALNTSSDINLLSIQNTSFLTNDTFAARQSLTGTSPSAVAYSPSASVEAGGLEPAIGYKTIWWTWSAPSNGRITISTTGSSAYGKCLGVYLGSSFLNLLPIAYAEGSTLDYPTVTIPVTAGQTYQISVGSYHEDDHGSIVLNLLLNSNTDINQLNITTTASAANDNFSNRTTLTGTTLSSIGYGSATTNEAFEPADSGLGSLWWTWTAPASGQVALSTTGSVTNTFKNLVVWTGSLLPDLVPVASQTNANTPSLNFTAIAGQTYHISIGGTSNRTFPTTAGTVVLSLNAPAGPAGSQPPDVTISTAVRLRWFAAQGAIYYVQSSIDMKNWQNSLGPLVGEGEFTEVFEATNGSAKFFRIFRP